MKQRPCRAFPYTCDGSPSPYWNGSAPGVADDWRRPAAPARDAGQPVWLDVAERLDQALGQRPGIVCRRAAARAARGRREWEVPLEDRLTVALICREMLGTLLSECEHPGRVSRSWKGSCALRRRPSNWKSASWNRRGTNGISAARGTSTGTMPVVGRRHRDSMGRASPRESGTSPGRLVGRGRRDGHIATGRRPGGKAQ